MLRNITLLVLFTSLSAVCITLLYGCVSSCPWLGTFTSAFLAVFFMLENVSLRKEIAERKAEALLAEYRRRPSQTLMEMELQVLRSQQQVKSFQFSRSMPDLVQFKRCRT